MKKAGKLLNSNSGAALITGLMVMLLVAVLGISYLTLSTNNLLRSDRDERRTTAFYLAEAGIEYAISYACTQAETNGGVVPTWNYDSTPLLDPLQDGATGSIDITPDSVASTYGVIVSTANYRGMTQTIRVRIRIKNVGIWDNAIFAGTGASGRGINGNVDIRGSVHILGEGDPYTDLNGNGVRDLAEPFNDANHNGVFDSGETFTDTDGNGVWSPTEPYQDDNLNGVYDDPLLASELASSLSGSANIGNHYSGMPVTLSNKIQPLSLVDLGGEFAYSLEAELRVKHGKVSISGSAYAGSANINGNDIKETLDGTYVSDGWTGNQGSSHVYSDNGTSQTYDLGDKVQFPSLFDPYTDPSTGIHYASFEAYIESRCMTVSLPKVDHTVADFNYTSGANSIDWDQDTNTLTISGIVRINSTFDIGGISETVKYSGKGTIFCESSIRVHGSVMPLTRFPTTDAIGFVAKQDINFATGPGESQLYAAGAWFAQGRVVSAKQNQFAGTYVSNYFDMGTNVPSIYQSPTLPNNLPPGMPGGGKRISIAQIISWRLM